MKMLAYHNDPAVKELYLERVKAHREADEITQGQYWIKGKGCAVGCTIHSAKHVDYENLMGIPEELAFLEDAIFEALPNELAMAWPERFLEAIQVGADLSKVWPKFGLWLIDGIQFMDEDLLVKSHLNDVTELYRKWAIGDKPNNEAWEALIEVRGIHGATVNLVEVLTYAGIAPCASAEACSVAYYCLYTHLGACSDPEHEVQAAIEQSEKLLQLLAEA